MKNNFRNSLIFPSLLLLCVVFFSCHERGCTDPAAINYNITADEDDGSCIICKSTETPYGYITADLIDFNSASQYYNDTVARFHFRQKLLVPSDKHCGSEKSSVTLNIENLLNRQMYFSYTMNYFGPVYLYSSGTVVLNPYETQAQPDVSTNTFPPFISINLDSVHVYSFNNIFYY